MRSRWFQAWQAVSILAAGCALYGQAPIERKAPEAPLPTLTLAARLVTVAVNAVDSSGSPVGGLEQKDFRLLEDGREQKIAFFDKESVTPLSIVLAVDGSESVLRNEKLEMQAAKKFVNTLLRPQDELDLMGFSDDVREFVPFTNDKKRIDEGLGQFQRGDATAVYNAIFLASQRLGETNPGGGRRRVLVLITDGGDTVHGVRYEQALEQAQRAGVMVYSLIVIPIYADAGRNTGGEHALIQMAEDTGGKYFYVQEARDLAPLPSRRSRTTSAPSTSSATTPREKNLHGRTDGFRALKIEVTDKDKASRVELRFRTGYYAGK